MRNQGAGHGVSIGTIAPVWLTGLVQRPQGNHRGSLVIWVNSFAELEIAESPDSQGRFREVRSLAQTGQFACPSAHDEAAGVGSANVCTEGRHVDFPGAQRRNCTDRCVSRLSHAQRGARFQRARATRED